MRWCCDPEKTIAISSPVLPLDDTLAIFMVPPRRDSPQTDLLEHYFSMTLSKCYRSSGGRLSCITCHDPHVEPAKQDAPAYYRAKCLDVPQRKKLRTTRRGPPAQDASRRLRRLPYAEARCADDRARGS